jgi:hypothetical protein
MLKHNWRWLRSDFGSFGGLWIAFWPLLAADGTACAVDAMQKAVYPSSPCAKAYRPKEKSKWHVDFVW